MTGPAKRNYVKMMFWLVPFVMVVVLGLVATVVALELARRQKFAPMFCGADRVTSSGLHSLPPSISAGLLSPVSQYIWASVVSSPLRTMLPTLLASDEGFPSFGSYAVGSLVVSAAGLAITEKTIGHLRAAIELICRFHSSASRASLLFHGSSCLRATERISGGFYGI
jgi:hypothetical protein